MGTHVDKFSDLAWTRQSQENAAKYDPEDWIRQGSTFRDERSQLQQRRRDRLQEFGNAETTTRYNAEETRSVHKPTVRKALLIVVLLVEPDDCGDAFRAEIWNDVVDSRGVITFRSGCAYVMGTCESQESPFDDPIHVTVLLIKGGAREGESMCA
jgi:hypothetical protein